MNLEEWDAITSEHSEVTTNQLDQAVKERNDAKKAYSNAKEEATKLYNEFQMKEGMLMELLEKAGKRKYVTDEGTASITHRFRAPGPKTIEDKQAFKDYVVNKYDEDYYYALISVQHQTANKFYKTELEQNNGEPVDIPGMGDPETISGISFRKKQEK